MDIALGLPARMERARPLAEPFPLCSHRPGARVARLRCPILRAGKEIMAHAQPIVKAHAARRGFQGPPRWQPTSGKRTLGRHQAPSRANRSTHRKWRGALFLTVLCLLALPLMVYWSFQPGIDASPHTDFGFVLVGLVSIFAITVAIANLFVYSAVLRWNRYDIEPRQFGEDTL